MKMTLTQFLKQGKRDRKDIITFSGTEALLQVKIDGYALQYVKEQTHEICLEDLRKEGYRLD